MFKAIVRQQAGWGQEQARAEVWGGLRKTPL